MSSSFFHYERLGIPSLLCHAQSAPHDDGVSGEGADELVFAGLAGGTHFDRLFLAGFEELGGGEDLRQWAPKQTPVLVPIPIPAERRTRHSDRRHSARGD